MFSKLFEYTTLQNKHQILFKVKVLLIIAFLKFKQPEEAHIILSQY